MRSRQELVERLAQIFHSIGAPRITVMCDQETAIKELQQDIRTLMWQQVISWLNGVKQLKEQPSKDQCSKV